MAARKQLYLILHREIFKKMAMIFQANVVE